MDLRDHPAKVKAYKERMAALKIQKNVRGRFGRKRAQLVRMKKRLLTTTQVRPSPAAILVCPAGSLLVSYQSVHSNNAYVLCVP
jgi:hypothetical protein